MNLRGAGILVCMLALSPPAAAQPHTCVVLVGDGMLAAEVRAELVARKVDTTVEHGCNAVTVTLSSHEGSIGVDVVDAGGHASHRRVAKVGEAVSWIESWARPELSADLMAGFVVEVEATPSTPRAAPTMSAIVTVGQPPRRPADPLSVSLTGDVAFDRGSTAWLGGSATVCARVSIACIGATGHLRTGSAGDRSDAALLVGIDVAIAIRSVIVAPGIAAGGGNAKFDSGGQQQRHRSARGEIRATLSYPLARFVLLDVVVAADVSPWATQPQSQNASTDVVDPGLWVRVGAGLRLGAP